MTTYFNIHNLLPEIKHKIYLDHFKFDFYYDDLNKILNHETSKKLNIILLSEYVQKYIHNNNEYIKYLQKNHIFATIYDDHYVNNDKYFIKMNTHNSLCTSWLFYLYH
jgi:hypothetical protein